MKRFSLCTLVVALMLSVAVTAFGESATKEECMAKAKEAADMINAQGLEEAVAEINNKEGKFVWKDTYVFLMDMDGKMVAHPMKPSLIGKNMMDTPDKTGNMFFKEFVLVAKDNGEGWVEYMWPKPGAEEPSKKISYILRVPGKDLFVGAGIYE